MENIIIQFYFLQNAMCSSKYTSVNIHTWTLVSPLTIELTPHPTPFFCIRFFSRIFFSRDYIHPDTRKIDSDLSTATYRPRSSNPIKKTHSDPPAAAADDVL